MTLNPCRNCGNKAIIIENKYHGVVTDYYIQCTKCNNRSYICIKLETAIKEWNEANKRSE